MGDIGAVKLTLMAGKYQRFMRGWSEFVMCLWQTKEPHWNSSTVRFYQVIGCKLLLQIKPVSLHYFAPCLNEVIGKLLFRIIKSISFSDGAQFRV